MGVFMLAHLFNHVVRMRMPRLVKVLRFLLLRLRGLHSLLRESLCGFRLLRQMFPLHHMHLRARDAAPIHGLHLQARSKIQRRSRLLEHRKRYSNIE